MIMEEDNNPENKDANVRLYLNYMGDVLGVRDVERWPISFHAKNYLLCIGAYGSGEWLDSVALRKIFGGKKEWSVTKNLGDLVDAGFIETQQLGDGRERTFKLTEKGVKAYEALATSLQARFEHCPIDGVPSDIF